MSGSGSPLTVVPAANERPDGDDVRARWTGVQVRWDTWAITSSFPTTLLTVVGSNNFRIYRDPISPPNVTTLGGASPIRHQM